MRPGFTAVGVYLTLLLMFGWMFYSMYLTYIDGTIINPAITHYNDTKKLETDKATYKRGETVKVRFSYCKFRQYEAKVTWRIVNQTAINFPEKTSNVATVGCKGVDEPYWVPVAVIPETATPGPHVLEAVNTLKVNSLRTIFIEFRTVEFQVL